MRTWRPTAAETAVLLACIILAGVLALCVVSGPAWLARPEPGLTAAERLSAENDARSTLLQGLVGLLALAHALLTAFVRQHAPWPPSKPDSEVLAERARLQGGLPDDIGAAITVLGRQKMIVGDAESELERVDLRGAELQGLNLPKVCFAHANLDDANLIEANLANAAFVETTLRNTNLSKANLREADFTGALLDGAILRGADLSNAKLRGTDLAGVIADKTTKWPDGFPSPQPPT